MKHEQPAFWRGLKAGDIVSLSDEKTLAERMKENKGPTPESYQVGSVLVVSNDLFEWRFACLDANKGIWLLAKIADDICSLYVFEEGQWVPTTRKELVAEGTTFLFQQPENTEDFDPESLLYTTTINDDNSGIEYSIKPQGELHGKATWYPSKSGLDNQMATVVEYMSVSQDDKAAGNNELLLLEVGCRNAGVIKLMKGRPLPDADVSVAQR
jgi:hypothetical protein